MKMMRLALVSCGLVIGGLVSGVTAQACYDVVYGPLCMGDDDELCISECASPYNPKICSKYTREVTERMPESHCNDPGSTYVNCTDVTSDTSPCYVYYKCQIGYIQCIWNPSYRHCVRNEGAGTFTDRGIVLANVSDDCPV